MKFRLKKSNYICDILLLEQQAHHDYELIQTFLKKKKKT
jgi:hypothetical protein